MIKRIIHITTLLIFSLLLTACSTVKHPLQAEDKAISENQYLLTYPWFTIDLDVSFIYRNAAQRAIKSGFSKFILLRDDTDTHMRVIVYMFNDEGLLPNEFNGYPIYEAEEYINNRYLPLGMHPNAA